MRRTEIVSSAKLMESAEKKKLTKCKNVNEKSSSFKEKRDTHPIELDSSVKIKSNHEQKDIVEKRRSYSTTDSSSKIKPNNDVITSRLNVISIKPKKKDKIVINLKYTQYDIIETVAREMGYRITKSDKVEADIIWFDLGINSNLLSKLQSFQRINHFAGTNQIANKSNLARNLMRMTKLHPNSYSFFPQTWLIPSEFHELKSYAKNNPKDTYIIKPEWSSQGRGIYLSKNIENISNTS